MGGRFVYVAEEFQHSNEVRTVTLNELTEEMTVSFWLRIEYEGALDDFYADQNKRVFDKIERGDYSVDGIYTFT